MVNLEYGSQAELLCKKRHNTLKYWFVELHARALLLRIIAKNEEQWKSEGWHLVKPSSTSQPIILL